MLKITQFQGPGQLSSQAVCSPKQSICDTELFCFRAESETALGRLFQSNYGETEGVQQGQQGILWAALCQGGGPGSSVPW